jgi:hypothetical protein
LGFTDIVATDKLITRVKPKLRQSWAVEPYAVLLDQRRLATVLDTWCSLFRLSSSSPSSPAPWSKLCYFPLSVSEFDEALPRLLSSSCLEAVTDRQEKDSALDLSSLVRLRQLRAVQLSKIKDASCLLDLPSLQSIILFDSEFSFPDLSPFLAKWVTFFEKTLPLQKWCRSFSSHSNSDDRFHLVELRTSASKAESKLTVSVEELADLFTLLPRESRLETLDLMSQSSFPRSEGYSTALASVLPECPALTAFAFQILAPGSSTLSLISALTRCPHLTSLNLYPVDNLEHLIKSLPSTRISELVLQELTEAAAVALCEALPHTQLKVLRLDLKTELLDLLVDGLVACSSLESLNLFLHSFLEDCEEAFPLLCNGLPRLSSLVHLSFDVLNEFPEGTFEKLLSALSLMKLESLSLDSTLTNENIEKLTTSLLPSYPSFLHSLELAIDIRPFGGYHDKSLKGLFASLSKTSLRVLRIFGCALHKSAIEYCLNLVADTQLTLLTFDEVAIMPDDFVDIDDPDGFVRDDYQAEHVLKPDQLMGGANFTSRFPHITDRFCLISWEN